MVLNFQCTVVVAAEPAKIRIIYVLIGDYCVNPNVAGITVLRLGCQHAQVDILQEKIKEVNFCFYQTSFNF